MDKHDLKCRVCGNIAENNYFIAREMMFGTREKFGYFECSKCKCVQIEEIPDNLSKYYPAKYNSFDPIKKTKDNIFKRLLKKTASKHYLEDNKNPLGKFLLRKYGPSFLLKLKPTNAHFNSAILDVGSGAGLRLISLARDGFNNIIGIDPFIEKDIFYNNGVRIYKKDIFSFQGLFDVVMLNHSFEHMPNPEKVLKEVNRLIKPGAIALIRIPIADSYSWKKYGIDWFALDAPRHLHLFTPQSMQILANKTGFELVNILYDSNYYQFLGSEQYAADIPMRSKKSYYENPNNSIFSKQQIEEFKIKAVELNEQKQGDAACFYLKKIVLQ
jgi:SAM-dependent methyltransferase